MGPREPDVERVAADLLKAAVPGLELKAPSRGSRGRRSVVGVMQPDRIGRLVGRRVVLEIKVLSTLRIADLVGRLAMATLQLRRHLAQGKEEGIAVAIVPVAGPKAWKAAEEFMTNNAPDMGWAVLDRRGSARVVVPGSGIDVRKRAERDPDARQERRTIRLFSDLNSWMLKILLLVDAPDGLWGGPRQVVASPTELSRVAGVSVEMAHRLVRALESRDFLRRDPGGLRLVRRRALLDLWRVEASLAARPGVPVRWILGRPKNLRDGLQEDTGLVVAGFEACRQLGVLHATSESIELHVLGPFEQVLDRRRLEACSAHEADLWLLRCATPQSVSRGCVVKRGVRLVDALQAALDVAHRPDRGREQSDYLIDRVLLLGDES